MADFRSSKIHLLPLNPSIMKYDNGKKSIKYIQHGKKPLIVSERSDSQLCVSTLCRCILPRASYKKVKTFD